MDESDGGIAPDAATYPDEQCIQIEPSMLSEEALTGVIEAHVLQEGTDYGLREWSLDDKVASVRRQLDSGKLGLVFQPQSGFCSIAETEEIAALLGAGIASSLP